MNNFELGEKVYVVVTEGRVHSVLKAEVKEFKHSVNMSWIVVDTETGELVSTRNRIFKSEKEASGYMKELKYL